MLTAPIAVPTWLLCIGAILVLLGPVLACAAAWHSKRGERLRCHLLAREAKRRVLSEYPEDCLDLLLEQIASGKPELSAALEVELCRIPGQT